MGGRKKKKKKKEEKLLSVNEQGNSMREKMIRDLEAFKLSNVNEKLNSLYKNYQELVNKSPVR